jgi:hypothetical protein
MSNVISQADSKNMDKFIVSVSIDDKVVEGFSLEGVSGYKGAAEGFFRWYLFWRSARFPHLVQDDIERVLETLEEEKLPEGAESKASFFIIVEEFQDGTLISSKKVSALFSSYGYAMMFT